MFNEPAKELRRLLPSRLKRRRKPSPREETAEQAKEAKVVRPTEATPEQIIAAQAPLMKKLKYASQKYEPSELRGIVDALNRYSEVQVRRENLSLPSDQQIEFKKDNVDVNNAKAVEKYFNEKLLPQTDDDPEKATADGTAGKQ